MALRTITALLLLCAGCGSGACAPGDFPPPQWVAAYGLVRSCVDAESQAPVPSYRYADIDRGGEYGECGIAISERRRGTDLALPTYLHESCHYLGLDDEHRDARWRGCGCN